MHCITSIPSLVLAAVEVRHVSDTMLGTEGLGVAV